MNISAFTKKISNQQFNYNLYIILLTTTILILTIFILFYPPINNYQFEDSQKPLWIKINDEINSQIAKENATADFPVYMLLLIILLEINNHSLLIYKILPLFFYITSFYFIYGISVKPI